MIKAVFRHRPSIKEANRLQPSPQSCKDGGRELIWSAERKVGSLLKRNDTNVVFMPTYVTACCVLHNVCEVHHDGFNEDWLVMSRT